MKELNRVRAQAKDKAPSPETLVSREGKAKAERDRLVAQREQQALKLHQKLCQANEIHEDYTLHKMTMREIAAKHGLYLTTVARTLKWKVNLDSAGPGRPRYISTTLRNSLSPRCSSKKNNNNTSPQRRSSDFTSPW